MVNVTEMPDEYIVAMVTSGNVEAYGEIMKRYEPRLKRYVVYLIHNDAMASDVVQDTFIKAYKNMRSFNAKYKFSSWIYRIAHNEAMNAIKREKHIDYDHDVSEIAESSYEPTIIEDIDAGILKDDVKACLDNLDLKYREVLMLQYFEHMKYSEIADVLHAPTATIGVWAARGKTMLKVICERKGVKL